ncbi:MAG: M20/M25/M40 family metallo-hydrolase [Myxococcales bacterium]|nr:M20/M25/M40 family metallo-hydrolase [Myxococcales bacterium]
MGSRLDSKSLARYVAESRPEFEAELRRLVEIPTVSLLAEHRSDIRRGAEAAAKAVTRRGGTAEVLETRGNPVVIGRFLSDPKHPTVTVYNHLDVQPAEGESWKREPFRLSIEGDRYYGRGATDDKGPALSVLFAAAFAKKVGLPVNIQFIWELEEEIGSPNFNAFLQKHHKALRSDVVIVSDTVWLAKGKPAMPSGLRGLQGATLRLETGTADVHSGLTGGGARNPVIELANLLAKLSDGGTGKVRIKGFYDDVIPISKAELASFERCGFSMARFKKVYGLRSLRSNDPLEIMQAIWSRPTFEVHGIAGGYQGPGIKTIVPPFAEAKVSLRLVPDQTPAKAFELLAAEVKRLNPDVVVTAESALAPFRGETTGPLAEAAASALKYGFGQRPAFVREGGSIGAVVTMKRHLACPIHFIGLSLPDHGYHAPNEYFDWGQAAGGMRTFVKYFELAPAALAASRPAAPRRRAR